MNLYQYEGKIVRVIDKDGRAFTGIPVSFPHEYGYHEFNRDEESIVYRALYGEGGLWCRPASM